MNRSMHEGDQPLAMIGKLDRHRNPFRGDDLAPLAPPAFEEFRRALVGQRHRRRSFACRPSPAGVAEIDEPQRADAESDGEAQWRALHQLAKAAFEDRRHEQHEDGADRHLRRQPAVQGEILDPRIAAREQDLFRDHQAAGRKQDQRAQFGDAVDREPAEKVDGQVAVVVQCDEGAERQALIDRQHHGRDRRPPCRARTSGCRPACCG